MTQEQLKEFVLGYCDGRIFSSNMIPGKQLKRVLHLIFMPLGVYGFSGRTKEEMENIAIFYENINCSIGNINEYPIFPSCRIMNKDDWNRVIQVIKKETERRKNIKV